jgi:hypothetical protein
MCPNRIETAITTPAYMGAAQVSASHPKYPIPIAAEKRVLDKRPDRHRTSTRHDSDGGRRTRPATPPWPGHAPSTSQARASPGLLRGRHLSGTPCAQLRHLLVRFCNGAEAATPLQLIQKQDHAHRVESGTARRAPPISESIVLQWHQTKFSRPHTKDTCAHTLLGCLGGLGASESSPLLRFSVFKSAACSMVAIVGLLATDGVLVSDLHVVRSRLLNSCDLKATANLQLELVGTQWAACTSSYHDVSKCIAERHSASFSACDDACPEYSNEDMRVSKPCPSARANRTSELAVDEDTDRAPDSRKSQRVN